MEKIRTFGNIFINLNKVINLFLNQKTSNMYLYLFIFFCIKWITLLLWKFDFSNFFAFLNHFKVFWCIFKYFQTHKNIFTLLNFMSKVKINKVTFNSPICKPNRKAFNEWFIRSNEHRTSKQSSSKTQTSWYQPNTGWHRPWYTC